MSNWTIPQHLWTFWNMESSANNTCMTRNTPFHWYMHFLSVVFAGGREKAPAAFCRKAITSTDKFEMWGDGLQTRSFTFIDECVEGVLR